MDGSKRAYTVRETARLLSASESWVRIRIKSGDIPHIKLGGRILVPATAIEQLLEVQR